jgi:hypothetical protein
VRICNCACGLADTTYWSAAPTLRVGEDRNIDTARTIEGGIGHDLPQEAPGAFAEAILEAGRS